MAELDRAVANFSKVLKPAEPEKQDESKKNKKKQKKHRGKDKNDGDSDDGDADIPNIKELYKALTQGLLVAQATNIRLGRAQFLLPEGQSPAGRC